MLLDPHDLRCGKARKRRICRDLNEAFTSDKTLDIFTFLCGTLVAPNDRGTKHVIVFVEHDKTVHLTGNTNADDITVANTAFFNDRTNGISCRMPPILGILLCPTVLRLIHRIFHESRCHRYTVFVKKNRLCTRGSKVNTDYITHIRTPFDL